MDFTRRRWIAAAGAAAGGFFVPRASFAQTRAIKVAAGQIAPHAEAYFAQDQGFFQKYGLSATVSTFRGGAANAAAVAGGDMNIGVSSVLQLAQAHAHGIGFVVIAAGGDHESRFRVADVLVPTASPLMSAKDLSGKTIGASSLSGLDELAVRAFIDRGGGDATSAKFVELPPVSQLAALQQGRIDACSMEDPERQAALASGAVRSLGDPEDAIAGVFAETAWFTTSTWLAGNKDIARRFAQAIYEAGAWAMQNPAASGAILAKYLKVENRESKQRYALTLRMRDFQSVLDAGAKYKLLPPLQADTFVWNGK